MCTFGHYRVYRVKGRGTFPVVNLLSWGELGNGIGELNLSVALLTWPWYWYDSMGCWSSSLCTILWPFVFCNGVLIGCDRWPRG